MKPYISFRGVRTNVSVKTFVVLAILALAIGLSYMWCMFGGINKFGGWQAVLAFILLTIEVTSNGRTYAIIPWAGVRGAFTGIVGFAAFIYYFV